MPFFRTIAALAYVGFFMLASIVLLPIDYFIRKKNTGRADRFSSSVINWGFRCVTAISGSKTDVYGAKNIPSGDRGILFVGNHRSYFDLIAGYPKLPFKTAIISKAGLKKVPAIGSWMKRMDCLFLERDNMRQGMQVILDGVDLLKNGTNILVFPEGTRNTGEGVGEFHAGTFKLASKSKSKIVPVVQTCTREIFETQFPWLKPQRTTLTFLPPIDTDDLSKDELKVLPEKIHEIMENEFNKITG